MSRSLRVLIVGGYGTFGGRLAELLCSKSGLELLIAGRSRAKADAFCKKLAGSAELIAAAFDRNGDVEQQLRQLKPDILVDASGPFQSYGENRYRLVQSCINVGVSYLDLADGSDFVEGIADFDQQARAKGVFVLSGVSSFPVLTAAVVRELSKDLRDIDVVKGGIAPSPYAGVGLNVIRAIASYAGQPVKIVRDRALSQAFALTETKRYTVAPPGRLPLHSTRFSLVDVPDLLLLPKAFPELQSVWMGAGPVPEVLHRMLNGLAWLVRWRILPSLGPLAGLFHIAINILRWGEHRGGMFVEIKGHDCDGHPAIRSWHLLAEGSDGPMIPSMAVEGIIRKALAGDCPPVGARPALTSLELSDYEALFANRNIETGLRRNMPVGAPLYKRVMGDAFAILPRPLRELHDVTTSLTARGRADVRRGRGLVARLIAAALGFPEEGRDVPVEITFTRDGQREIWRRTFGTSSFQSVQSEGRGRSRYLIDERFGPITVSLAPVVTDSGLALIVRRWRIFGMPLPLALAPSGNAREYGTDQFHFDVEIRQRWVGLIVRYTGWLAPETPAR